MIHPELLKTLKQYYGLNNDEIHSLIMSNPEIFVDVIFRMIAYYYALKIATWGK